MKAPILTAVFLAYSLSGCGKFFDKFSRIPGGFTQLNIMPDKSGQRSGVIGFHDPIHSLVDVLQGGLMVYAVNTDTGKVYSTSGSSENGAISLRVPNGNYSFAGAGWENTYLITEPSSTVRMRCGFGANKTLTGASESVTLNLANLDECYSSNFFAPSFAKQPTPFPATLKLKMAFCGKGVDLSSNSTGSSCENELASSHFFRGTSTAKMDKAAYFASSNALLFAASKNGTGNPPALPYELFRHDFSTGKQTKIGMSFPNSTPYGVKHLRKVPGREKLLFVRDNGSSSPDELWTYNLSNGSLTKISQGTVNGAATGVREFRLSDDGNYVVFVGDMETNALDELYSVPIPASGDTYAAPTKISGALTGNGVRNCGACTGDQRYFFQISPGLSNYYVVYSGIQALASRDDLHIASVNNSNFPNTTLHGAGSATISSGTKISYSEIATAGDYADFMQFSFDGTHLLYHVHTSTPAEKIYQLDISYTGTALNIPVPTVITVSNAAAPYFKTGKSTQRAVYYTHDATYAEMRTVNMANPGSTNFILYETGQTPGSFEDVELINGDSTVIAALKGSTEVLELRSASTSVASDYNGGTAPDGTSITYTGGLLAGGRKLQSVSGQSGGGKHFLVTSDNTKVLFNADTGTLGVFQLRYGVVGTPGSTDISGTGVVSSGTSVTSFALSSNDTPYFSAAIDVATKPELYRTQLLATPAVTRMNSHLATDSLVSISGKEDELQGFPDLIILDAHPLSQPAVTEAWSFDPSTAAFKRISVLSGNSNGAGRFKVSMLKSADGSTFSNGIASECLSMDTSQNDGTQILTDVRVPLGPGAGPSPFATAIDIYPLATDCNGAAETHVFPSGLATANPCTAAGGACLLGSGSNLVLFLKDQ